MTRFERRRLSAKLRARAQDRNRRLLWLLTSWSLVNLVFLMLSAVLASGCDFDTCRLFDVGCTPPPPAPPRAPGATEAHWAPPSLDGGAPAPAQAPARD